ncbi:MAG: outer membrane protein assembly factor BamC [Proteobacteria bacterium]|nr:outer membrane protein assembly factor BamC [Pseudomonadota bacterium]
MINSRKLVVSIVMMTALTGCSTLDKLNPFGTNPSQNYKAARLHPPIDVPPGLTLPSASDEYNIPNSVNETTYSEYSKNHSHVSVQGTCVKAGLVVLPGSNKAVLKRDGQTRWLRVNLPAHLVWPIVESYWEDQGYKLTYKNALTGVMQTNWRPIGLSSPQIESGGGQSNLMGEMSMYSTRLERGAKPDTTEVYVSYHGAIETNGNSDWHALPPNPRNELGQLMNLLQRFGVSTESAKNQVLDLNRVRAKIVDQGTALFIKQGFKNAWRRIGLALDREDFMVENRDRASGIYYVKYKTELPIRHVDTSWWSKIEFWKKSPPKKITAGEYHVKVTGDQKSSLIQIQDANGLPLENNLARKIIAVLDKALK